MPYQRMIPNDLGGFGRLTDQLNFNRQQAEREKTADLQRRDMSLGIEQKEMQLADMAATQQFTNDFRAAYKNKPKEVDDVKFAYDFANNAGRQDMAQKVLSRADAEVDRLMKIDPKAATEYHNKKLAPIVGFTVEHKEDTQWGSSYDVTDIKTGMIQKAVFDKNKGEFSLIPPPQGTAFYGKKSSDTMLGKLLSARNALPDGSPDRALYDQRIGKLVSQTGQKIEIGSDGSVRITEGPIDKKAEDAKQKEKNRIRSIRTKADITIGKVDEALEQTGVFTTGLLGTGIGIIPGTQAYDLDNTIDTIKANIGFRELQDMRDASPTGGALGQVSEREINFLQSALASLNKGQSQKQLEKNLRQVKFHYENWKRAIEQDAIEKELEENQNIPDIKTEEEYNNLPSGALYMDEGTKLRKP